MIHVRPFCLWLGHAGDCGNSTSLADIGIEAVVCLAIEESLPSLPRDLLVFRFPLLDGEGNRRSVLQLSVGTVAHLLCDEFRTLVCCSAGASRSPAVAACALATVQHTSPTECLRIIRQFRKTDLSPALWQELLGLHDEWT